MLPATSTFATDTHNTLYLENEGIFEEEYSLEHAISESESDFYDYPDESFYIDQFEELGIINNPGLIGFDYSNEIKELTLPINSRTSMLQESAREIVPAEIELKNDGISARSGNTSPDTSIYLPSSSINRRIDITLSGIDSWYHFDVFTANTKINVGLPWFSQDSYDLHLFRLEGNTLHHVAFSENEPAFNVPDNLGYITSEPGTYYVWIRPYIVKNTLSTSLGIFTSDNSIEEFGANNNFFQALSVPHNYDTKTAIGAMHIDNPLDEKWFSFQADGVNFYAISFVPTSSGMILGDDFRISIHDRFGEELFNKTTNQLFSENFRLSAGEYKVRVAPINWSGNQRFNYLRFRINPNNGVTNYNDTANYYQIQTTVQDYYIQQYAVNDFRASLDFVQLGLDTSTAEPYFILMKGHGGFRSPYKTHAEAMAFINLWLENGRNYRIFGNNPLIRRTIWL